MVDHRLRFVVFRYGHHSPHSGYSRLAEFGARAFKAEVIRVGKPLSRFIIRNKILWRLAHGTPGYDRAAMAAELKMARKMLLEGRFIYHILYGETTYHYAGLLKNLRKNHLVATFHLPPAGIRSAVQVDWHLRRLSAVVCVGRSQQEFFERILDRERIFFVPLGIDTDYYTPPITHEDRDPNLCLFVGENYRDFPTLRGVVELVAYMRPDTRFVVVAPQRSFPLIGSHPQMTTISGVPEPELLQLYRSAALMVMPLTDATANNAILESMACGLPMVVSDVGSIRDYVSPDCASLVPAGDSRGMAEAVLALLEDPLLRKSMSGRSREQALSFSWQEVVKQLRTVYAALS